MFSRGEAGRLSTATGTGRVKWIGGDAISYGDRRHARKCLASRWAIVPVTTVSRHLFPTHRLGAYLATRPLGPAA